MASFQAKLEEGKYDELTEAKFALLERASNALFQSKTKSREEILINSYKPKRLPKEIKGWKSDPTSFLVHKQIQESDAMVIAA